MRKLLLIVMVALFAIQSQADNVKFSVSDGIDNAGVKSKIESGVSRMLTEINVLVLVFSNQWLCCGKIVLLSVPMKKSLSIVSQQVQAIRFVIFP